ncbi:TPA: hypothetical protein ACH3X2_011865 [Trebouxia sp. C0005]
MKISIDLDIEASEIPLATELLNTLRSLTEHIRVRQHQENGHVPNGMSHSPEPDVPLQPDAGSMAPAAAPQATQAPAPQEGQDSTTLQRQQALSNYIRSAIENFGGVVKNLEQALASADPEVEKLFLAAFGEVVLDPKYLHGDEAVQIEHSTYIGLLREMNADIRRRISQALVQVLVKKLMERANQPRTALMLPAIVYAHLVLLDMANVRGTLKMVEKFLTNGHEAVGLTMLGKTAEMCIDKVLQHASPVHLTSLTAALDRLGPQFNYDVDYLNGFIRWKDPCFRVLSTRKQSHYSAISALAYDPNEKQLISASRDGVVLVWDEWANVIQKHMLGPTHYAIGLAVLPEQRDVIIVGQPLAKGSPACIAAIGLDEPHPLKGPWSRPRTTTASCIAILPGGRQFAVGETQSRPGEAGPSHVICVYDCASLQSADSLQPTVNLVSTNGAVMCLSGYSTNKQVLLAGTRGGDVSLWTLSSPAAPVKIFSMPQNAGVPLCLDYDGLNAILCGTSQNMLVHWDMQMMAQVKKPDPLPYSRTFQVDTYAVVKVQFWPNQQHGMHAAIITSHGCWIADLASNPKAKPNVKHVQDVQGDDCSFTGAAWAGQYPYLYVGGASQKVHVCQLVPE